MLSNSSVPESLVDSLFTAVCVWWRTERIYLWNRKYSNAGNVTRKLDRMTPFYDEMYTDILHVIPPPLDC